MEDQLLAIREYQGEGYQPLIDYGSWRMAILRWGPGSQAEEIEMMERHTQTESQYKRASDTSSEDPKPS